MSDINASLGPLERVNGRWAVGDSQRPGGAWLEFRADGLYQHAGRSKRIEEQLIPWSRVMLCGFSLGARYPSMGSYTPRGLLGGLPGPWKHRGRGYLHLTLRHPYEDWVATFDRHPRWYNLTHLSWFQELLRQTAREGEARRFADAEWLGRAVELLAVQRIRSARGMREAVAAARRL
ncbi:hypothetical protein OG372_16160 [Streptomyces sp. NBC_01020]|uniref:hypothetical protein n=1 Tax=Streptomyces sp. NBC_01020 TaxID=2903722 RepID=UPI0038662DF6|nr:hypothetical protein OG372_16160 [Streptomyces sp. NBC_01020]